MNFSALVIDSEAVDALDSALIEAKWFDSFQLPQGADKLKRVVINNVCYLLGKSCSDDSRLLIFDLQNIPILSSERSPRYPFERALRVALHSFRPEVAIPIQWQAFHSGKLLSIYADNISKQSAERLYFDQDPESSELGHVYVFASRKGYNTFDQVPPDYDAYRNAVEHFVDAVLSEPEPVIDAGHYGLLLSEPLGAQISGSASLDEWYDKRVTAQQRDFIDRPLSAPVRLRGAAGTGKTQSIAIKCLRELSRLEAKQKNVRLAVITHSSALAHDVIRGMLFAMDQSESWSRFQYASLWLGTLYQLAQEILQYEKKGLEPLSLDGREGREYQRMLIKDSVDEITRKPQYQHDLIKTCSVDLRKLLSEDERSNLVEELMNEFSSVIDADSIHKGSPEAENYIKTTRETWQPPFSEADRRFILDVHEAYSRRLRSENLLSMDQMIADFNRYLLTHEWRQLRDKHGFDVVFVDEYHYFNRAESTALHHIFKSDAHTDGKLPLFMAYDLKQGLNDVALRQGSKSMTNFMATKAGKSELVELTEIFRSTPEIADFLKDIDGSFPSLDLEGEWQPYGGISKVESGDKPSLIIFPTDTQLIDAVFAEAKLRSAELKEGGRQVAVLCMNERLFDQYRNAGRIRDQFVAITSRDDMNELRYAKRKCVFSMPDYVAGLQFDSVILIHVDANDYDSQDCGTGHQRRFISRLYSGASRASHRLTLVCSEARGGISQILAGPLANGSLVVRDKAPK